MEMELDTPVQYLKGVGPHYSKVLERRGIFKLSQLLEWYPRAYEDRRAARNISSLKEGEIVSLKAEIVNVRPFFLGRTKRKIYDVLIKDSSGQIHCKYFRVPFKGYFEKFETHMKVRVVGKVLRYRGVLEFHHPDIKEDIQEENQDQMIPIYTETEGITPQKLLKIMYSAIDGIYSKIPETLPQSLLTKYSLPNKKDSLKYIHQPPKDAGSEFSECASPYHKRLIFEEFFWFQLYLAIQDKGKLLETAHQMKEIRNYLSDVKKHIPFELTQAQVVTLNEVIHDITQNHPMRRLVQGDVGSGKTIVSLLAAHYVIKNGYQVALMVPTEILADQHFKNATHFLGGQFNIQVGLLKGSQTQKEKQEVYDKIKNGELDLIVGTHAIIQDDVEFKNLALAIVDEQHRFGVLQRQKLKQKGLSPHFLLMTATPIPRTLALTVYGDLECSIINELPKGRIPIVTRVVFESKRRQVYEFLRDQLKKGRQAYIIYPLVEESEKIDLKDAITGFDTVCAQFPEFKVGLLHGKMKTSEKDEIMERFRKNELQILVSTTVIEVGVDVPNSNMMIIEHSERFGLSQLHQLRGRVGRGEHKSYCVLMLGHAVSEESRNRTQIMAETSDGFKISEKDLEFRGPGEFMGAKQSGLPGFKLGNLVRDFEILKIARESAFDIINKDPKLTRPENKVLKDQLVRIHGKDSLITVG